MSSDKNVVKQYLDDPLTHDQVSAKFYVEYLAHADMAIERAQDLVLPLLVIHGANDKIVSIQSSEHIFETARSEDKTKETFEGLFHETMNEKVEGREKVLQDPHHLDTLQGMSFALLPR